MVFECTVEHSVLFSPLLAFGALIDEVLADKLLELLQQKHALGVCDRQRAEGIEAWVLSVSLPLRVRWDGRHQIALLARQVEVFEHFTLSLRDLLDARVLLFDER